MKIYLLLNFVAFLAGFAQGLSGFGSILLALPLLALFMDIKVVIPLLALHGLAMTSVLLVQLRTHLEWKKKINPLFLGSIPGIPIGVLFLKTVDAKFIQLIVGAILVAYSLFSLRRQIGGVIKDSWAYVFGFFAGFLGGAVSASGPPVIIWTSLQPWGKDTIKATLQGFYVVSGALIVLAQIYHGLTTLAVWLLFFISLPALLIGTYAGSFFYGKISDRTYRKIMFILLSFLGLLMIYVALAGTH